MPYRVIQIKSKKCSPKMHCHKEQSRKNPATLPFNLASPPRQYESIHSFPDEKEENSEMLSSPNPTERPKTAATRKIKLSNSYFVGSPSLKAREANKV